MSHFAVMVAIPNAKNRIYGESQNTELDGEFLDDILKEMMAPFQENNMGDCPEEFLEFHDTEEENKKEYETEIWEGYRKEQKNGRFRHVSKYDKEIDKIAHPVFEKIRKEREKEGKEFNLLLGLDTSKAEDLAVALEVAKALAEKGWEKIKIPMKEVYATFEQFMTSWHGTAERDPKTGKYGYWENPNRKWDFWTLGGRWSGHLRIKEGVEPIRGAKSWTNEKEIDDPHTADAAYKEDIDFEGLELLTEGRIDEFWKDLQGCIEAHKAGDERKAEDFNVRIALGDMGIVTGREPMITYVNGLTLEDLKTKYRPHFEWGTYAYLDENGWREPGKMGWWGCSSATPETPVQQQASFAEWLKSKPEGTLFAVVDCHI